jgi:hypothetical protein
MAHTPANIIPPHILNAAIRAYVETAEPVDDICGRLKISHATLQRERRARGIPPRRLAPRQLRQEPRPDRYALEPATEKQRAVWAVWRAHPNAPPSWLAERSGATTGYVSRLVGHWRAVEQGYQGEPARCPHCGGALGEVARRG